MTQATILPFGTALALAQRTLSAPLDAVLHAEGVGMGEWLTLHALGLRGPTSLEVLVDLLPTDGSDPVAALDRAGLVQQDGGVVSPTPAGTTRYTTLRDRITQVTTRIFEQFDAVRVEDARSLLQEIAGVDPAELTRRTVGAS